MSTFYIVVIVVISAALGFLTSARVGYVLASKWKLSSDATGCLCVFPGIASAIIMGVASYALVQAGGILFGLVGCFLVVPAVGLGWILIVGGNKAIEKILQGLLSKVA